MAKEHSFDIASKANITEVDNAIHQAVREIETRFDLKGGGCEIRREENTLTLVSSDEFKLRSVVDLLQGKLVKRGISLKFLDYGPVEDALGATKRQAIRIKQGIPQEKAKEINRLIKDGKFKVNSQIQGDEIRVFAKSIDDLQVVMQKIKSTDVGIELQFVNYR